MTINKASNNTETPQGDAGAPRTSPGPPSENVLYRTGNAVLKSGPLFISSKGIGWTSWKKRWFILTRNSLVFFRSDPSVTSQRGSEVNLTLGGIDLNNSGSVIVKTDKKLITVLFADGRDGRTFTLKAETTEDLHEWKAALENALAQAPSSTLSVGQNGTLKNDQTDNADAPVEQLKEKVPAKSLVLGRPVLLALEDVDGSPSFLEKALRCIEEYGIKVEGILRQAAAVDDVEHRIREFEQGKTEFSSTEDAHVIADCVKYFLRELPSSPVPASCCNALLESFRRDRNNRANNMRVAILETFPEPNRRLLQRILLMMQVVASNKSVNRMSSSAVAACMAPLLLRPLLAGECEIESDFNMGGDGSIQLLQAAAAANHAQAIVITLLEEYDKIFGVVEKACMSPGLYSDSDEGGSGDEEVTDEDESYEDDEQYTDDDLNDGSIGNVSDDDHLPKDKAKKNLSLGSVDFFSGDEDDIAKLESTKTELKQRISDEVKGNEALQISMEQRRKMLHEHRLALEQDVARLQEELQRERDKRALLERGLNKSDGPIPSNVDEKIAAELDQMNRMEADVINLEQKVDDLNLQINQHREQNNSSTNEQNKHQQPDAAPNSDPKTSTNSKTSMTAKRSGSRGEGVNSTASALSKLTTRLNFLKERRGQLNAANAVGSPVHKGSENAKSSRSADKTQGPETRAAQNSDTARSQGPEIRAAENSDRGKGSESSRSDKGQRSEDKSHNKN